MSDELVKFLQTEAEEAARQASRDWDEEDEKRIAFAVLRDRLFDAAARIRLLEQQLKTARGEERERCARLADDKAIRHGDAVLNLPRGSSAQRLASYASVTLIEFAATIRSLGEKE